MPLFCCGCSKSVENDDDDDHLDQGQPRRNVSIIERYAVMHNNNGHPQIVSYIASFPAPSSSTQPLVAKGISPPTFRSLSERISYLQDRFPLLWSHVEDQGTTRPFFQQRKNGKWAAEDVIRVEELTLGQYDPAEEQSVLQREMETLETMTVRDRAGTPPWQITLFIRPVNPFRSPPSDPESDPTPAYVTLSVNHTHMDGTGGLRFFLLLLQPPLSPILASLPQESLPKIPAYEDTYDIQPKFKHMASTIYQEIFLPNFPKKVQTLIGKAQDPWPAQMIGKPMADARPRFVTGELDPSVVAALKARGKAEGVNTLHPLLHVAYTVALWSVVRHRRGPGQVLDPLQSKKESDKPFLIATGTAINERDIGSKNHSFCTAVYIADLESDLCIVPTSSFWELARAFSGHLASAQGRQRARGTIGLLNYLSNEQLSDGKTGWEAYFEDKAQSDTPVRVALALSNLGNVNTTADLGDAAAAAAQTPFKTMSKTPSAISLPAGLVSTLLWTQSATPYVSPVLVNVVGYNGHVRWTTSFRDGSVVSVDEVDRVNAVAKTIVQRLSQGSQGVQETAELLVDGLDQ